MKINFKFKDDHRRIISGTMAGAMIFGLIPTNTAYAIESSLQQDNQNSVVSVEDIEEVEIIVDDFDLENLGLLDEAMTPYQIDKVCVFNS